jgi:hypothetical protein
MKYGKNRGPRASVSRFSGALGLVYDALDLAFGIAGGATKAFFSTFS